MLIDNHQLSIVNYQLKKGGKARVSGNKSEDLPLRIKMLDEGFRGEAV